MTEEIFSPRDVDERQRVVTFQPDPYEDKFEVTPMPIFEFECGKCRHHFEHLCLSGGEAETLTCPECGSPKIAKLMSAFAGRTGSASGAGCGSCSATSCPPS